MKLDIVRAWKDEAYRESLSQQQKALLPANPAGELEMSDADLVGTNLDGTKLEGVDLSSADLRNADLQSIAWQQIAAIKSANIAGVKNAPAGFREWALKNGAIENANKQSAR